MSSHDLPRQTVTERFAPAGNRNSGPLAAVGAKPTSWAGWSMVGIAVLHVVFWSVVTWEDWGAWIAGGLWGAEPATALEYRLHHGYWALVGSFAVPLFLLGLVTVHLSRLGFPLPRYIGWVVLVWALIASALMEPNGFPLAFIPAAFLLRAQYLQRGTTPLPTDGRSSSALDQAPLPTP